MAIWISWWYVYLFQDKAPYKDDDFGDSDNEAEPDAYLERVKAEAQERDDNDDNPSSDESTDEDFKPGAESDVAEEYDSNHTDTSSDEESGSGSNFIHSCLTLCTKSVHFRKWFEKERKET